MKRVALAILTLMLALPAYAQKPSSKGGAHSPAQVSELPPKAKRWALVIGVDRYDDSQIGALDGAATDAKTLRDALIATAGFPQDQVVVLASGEPEARWPTRVNILRRLTNLVNKMPQDGLLLLAFSGHGIERERQAYLLPKDAQLSDDPEFLELTAISLNWIRNKIESSGIAQVVVLLDACRNDPGGRAAAPNRMSDAYIRPFTFDRQNHRIRAFATIYATAIGERAYEYAEKHQGYFTWAVVEGLKGAAANEKGEVTLSQLVQYVQETVPKRIAVDLGGGFEQLPLANIEGYLAADLVLSVTAPKSPSLPTPSSMRAADIDVALASDALAATEVKFWESVEKLNTAIAYDEYLRNYPSGTYAGLARMNKATIVAGHLLAQAAVEKAFRSGDYGKARGLLQKAADGGDAEAESRLGAMALLGLGTFCSTAEATRLLDSAAQKGSRTAEAWLGYLWASRGGSRTRGFEYAKASAERGDPVGLVALATAYEFGITIPPDLEAADRLYKQALPDLRARAEQYGDPWALETLGNLYARGRGGFHSSDRNALELFQKASERGLPEAKSSVAFHYAAIANVKESKKALALYEQAAAQSEPVALHALGQVYFYGWAGEPHNYQRAVEFLLRAADAGYPAAQSALAYMYAKGFGVAKDESRAAELYTLAASQGNPTALNNLAEMHVRGDAGLPKDLQLINDLYRKGAERGEARAQLRMGLTYNFGWGVPRDDAAAAVWYRKAADQYLPEAENKLGDFYADGVGGLPKDPIKAVLFYEKAADQGNAAAQTNLGSMYETGRGVHAVDLPMAIELYKKAADQGYAIAQRFLGNMYLWGSGVPKDPAKALSLYQKAADQDDPVAQSKLADWYWIGYGGLQEDLAKALAFYEKAANQGEPSAEAILGTWYAAGFGGLTKDANKAVEWYRKGAVQNDPMAQDSLGLMYALGAGGLEKNESLAVEWFRKAADQGYAAAQNNLAVRYETGVGGLTKDIDKAVDLYRKAAAHGNEEAKKNLSRLSR
jgi:TPR repeat protein